ncbi:unnamed protein product [Rotaria sp. Silwood2]|nr:unnamed protein product [Rotaria sp. Silwood2]CAF2811679.1 unnamed protein product [Rotaria sp. Silwood2]CAF3352535.1 unnamed protein product [Rotaria sp. Silwood2]CAF3382026.1 unnamed protein product [Rotaria sp. Silwood2]CAF4020094.1 unnamed protein product [Rotaria sp. Silwood2]
MSRENWRRYFDFSPFDKNRINGLCRLCNRNYKDQNGIYSNFSKHLKRVHPVEYDQVFAREYECLTEEQNVFGDDQITDDLTSKKYKQSRIIFSITKNLIIRCNLPLNFVENNAFRDFMKECNFKCEPISAKKLKNDIIPSFTNKVLKTIHETLNSINHVTLTVDAWSDRRCRSFLGITCHFIDNKMMPQAYLIDFLRFKSPHTSENIQQLTEEVLERFNIKQKVFKIITDNASSMIKAYKFGLYYNEENGIRSDQMKSISDISAIFDDFDRK